MKFNDKNNPPSDTREIMIKLTSPCQYYAYTSGFYNNETEEYCSTADAQPLDESIVIGWYEMPDFDDDIFKITVWSIIQELVWAHGQGEIAKELIKGNGLTIQDCIKLQKQSDTFNDIMIPFIESLEKNPYANHD